MRHFLLILILCCSAICVSAQDQASVQATSQPAVIKPVIKGVVNGFAINLPKPPYPEAAKDKGTGGQVKVQVIIDEEGNVTSAIAISGPQYLHDNSVAAALGAKFKPTLLSGEPVKVSGIIVYNYQPASYASRLKFMILGRILAYENSFDPLGFDIEKLITYIPAVSKELDQLKLLKDATAEKRSQILTEARAAIRKSQTSYDSWVFETGENFGGIFQEIDKMKRIETGVMDGQRLRMHLQNLQKLVSSAPAEFPGPVLEDLKALVELEKMQDLQSEKSIEQVIKAIAQITKTLNTSPTIEDAEK